MYGLWSLEYQRTGIEDNQLELNKRIYGTGFAITLWQCSQRNVNTKCHHVFQDLSSGTNWISLLQDPSRRLRSVTSGTYHNADCNTDHNLAASIMTLRPKSHYHGQKMSLNTNIVKLAQPGLWSSDCAQLMKKLNALSDDEDPGEYWSHLRTADYLSAKNTVRKQTVKEPRLVQLLSNYDLSISWWKARKLLSFWKLDKPRTLTERKSKSIDSESNKDNWCCVKPGWLKDILKFAVTVW